MRSSAGVGITPPNVPGAPKPASSVMMSNTLGAPFGGTTRGAHQGFDSEAFSLITPPNAAGGGGICFPVMVVVAPGEPNSPVTTCPPAGPESAVRPRRRTIRLLVCRTSRRKHMRNAPVLHNCLASLIYPPASSKYDMARGRLDRLQTGVPTRRRRL